MRHAVQVQQIPADMKPFYFKVVFDHTRIVLIYLIVLTVVKHENEVFLNPLRYLLVCFTGNTFSIITITSSHVNSQKCPFISIKLSF